MVELANDLSIPSQGVLRTIRVLHVLATVGQGGVETWLCNLLSRFKHLPFEFDVCFYRQTGNQLEGRFLSLGCKVFRIPLEEHSIGGLRTFLSHLRETIRTRKYDVVHCHGMSFIGVELLAAWQERVPVRVAHSHGTAEPARGIAEAAFLNCSKHVARRLATHRLGCSTEAAEALFGKGCLGEAASVLHCGLDVADSGNSFKPVSRESLDIPAHAMVVGCVANFTPPKNHAFLLSVFAQILRYNPQAHLLLVGEGDRCHAIRDRATELAILHRVRFLGRRDDVPALLPVFDVFILPSLTEGLPVALLEAQYQGIPCITSTAVTREAQVIPGLVRFLPLTAGLDTWAQVATEASLYKQTVNLGPIRHHFEQSPYSVEYGVSQLSTMYSNALTARSN